MGTNYTSTICLRNLAWQMCVRSLFSFIFWTAWQLNARIKDWCFHRLVQFGSLHRLVLLLHNRYTNPALFRLATCLQPLIFNTTSCGWNCVTGYPDLMQDSDYTLLYSTGIHCFFVFPVSSWPSWLCTVLIYCAPAGLGTSLDLPLAGALTVACRARPWQLYHTIFDCIRWSGWNSITGLSVLDFPCYDSWSSHWQHHSISHFASDKVVQNSKQSNTVWLPCQRLGSSSFVLVSIAMQRGEISVFCIPGVCDH